MAGYAPATAGTPEALPVCCWYGSPIKAIRRSAVRRSLFGPAPSVCATSDQLAAPYAPPSVQDCADPCGHRINLQVGPGKKGFTLLCSGWACQPDHCTAVLASDMGRCASAPS